MKSFFREKPQEKYKVSDPSVINAIEQHIKQKFSDDTKLILHRSKQHPERDALHFVIYSSVKIELEDTYALSVFIQDKIDFLDASVERNDAYRQDSYRCDFTDSVDYTAQNNITIEQFIDKNFPNFSRYQKQLKEHGCTFSDSEKMEREAAEALGKSIADRCQQEAESCSLVDEESIASLLTDILRITTKSGFDSKEILAQIDTSKVETPTLK